jgi:hypothetical protein
MTDGFARASAKNAHTLIRQLNEKLERLEKASARRSVFHGRCHLCGDPVRKGSRYCHAHDWAAGR